MATYGQDDADGDGDGPRLWVVRHGPTEWSAVGKHTGSSDIPLTEEGEREAASLRDRLGGVDFGLVLTSPLKRARRTAELAGFPEAEPEPLAVEWDYGDYEGLTRAEIRRKVPGWSPWTNPDMPNGERLDQVAARAGRVVDRVRGSGARDVLLFAHGHLLADGRGHVDRGGVAARLAPAARTGRPVRARLGPRRRRHRTLERLTLPHQPAPIKEKSSAPGRCLARRRRTTP